MSNILNFSKEILDGLKNALAIFKEEAKKTEGSRQSCDFFQVLDYIFMLGYYKVHLSDDDKGVITSMLVVTIDELSAHILSLAFGCYPELDSNVLSKRSAFKYL